MDPYEWTIQSLRDEDVQYLPGEYFYDGDDAENMGESAGLPGCVVIACAARGVEANRPGGPSDLRDWPRQARELLGLSEDAANLLFRNEDILYSELEVIDALGRLKKKKDQTGTLLSSQDVNEVLAAVQQGTN